LSKKSDRPIAAEGTDPGRERDNNEDLTLLDPDLGIYAVIDGVGGESGGEVAARIAADVLRARLSRRTTDTARLIREAIALANKQIYERAQDEPGLQGMSCVLTVAVLDEGQVTIGHVGDSRLYLLRRGTIRKVTRDHSPVGMREDAGELSELEAMHHPRRNEIFRDVGSAPHEPDEEGFIEIHQLPFDAESALLICSDGLSDMVTSGEILETVRSRPGNPAAAVRDLIAAANAAGGKDNISIVLVEGAGFGEDGARPAGGSAPAYGGTTMAGPVERRPPGQIRGAASARPGFGERLWSRLTSWPAFLLYGLAAGALALYVFRAPLRPWMDKAGLGGIFGAAPEPAHVLHVDAQAPGTTASPQTLRTIADALAQAQPGDTVEVEPGDYAGPFQLKDGVNLVSRTPRGAVIRLPKGVAEPAVSADSVHGVRFAGFKIAGSPDAPLAMGLRLSGSTVEVEDVEISGATTAGLEIAGGDRSAVRDSYIHDNPGAGVIVRDQAVPSLRNNLIHRNGTDKTVPGPGVEIRDAARPQLIGNKLEDNAAAAVWVPAADRIDEIFGFNSFGSLLRDKAVRVSPRLSIPGAPVPSATPVTTPSPRPRRSR